MCPGLPEARDNAIANGVYLWSAALQDVLNPPRQAQHQASWRDWANNPTDWTALGDRNMHAM